MRRMLLVLALIVVAAIAAFWLLRPTPAPPAAFEFVSSSITLPPETAALPASAAGELVTNNCTACHSVEMITRQPPLDAKKWAATVAKMRATYHAEIAPDADPALVKALLELQAARN